MNDTWVLSSVRESDLPTVAGLLAFALRAGDTVTLSGPLGAGKTTFARALISAFLGDPHAEVPSPTFSLVQTYETPRFTVAHTDLFRLAEAADLGELGLDETLSRGALVIEWPERAVGQLADERLAISLAQAGEPETRTLTFAARGNWSARLSRIQAAHDLIRRAGWGDARVHYLQGDASPRRYARLTRIPLREEGTGVEGLGNYRDSPPPRPSPADGEGGQPSTALLMDAPRQPDGPPIRDGLPYSRIAHLAEDVRPFVAVAGALRQAGLAAPAVLAHDLDRGLLLVEDLGDRVFGAELADGGSQIELWQAATDALLALRQLPVPQGLALPDGGTHRLPPYDRAALRIETELLVDWYWPALLGSPAPNAARMAFTSAWDLVLDRLLALPCGWVLRDYHSPNLIWLPGRGGAARVGIIDFQDAMAGHPAYDLVSLLQDARLDVPEAMETELLGRYCSAAATERGFSEADFRFAYAALGAQRNTKILGIFARLAHRDGKPQYLRHIPRIWGYLARNLAVPELTSLRAWYDRHLPPNLRGRDLGSRSQADQ